MHKRSEIRALDADLKSVRKILNESRKTEALKFQCEHPIKCSHIACEDDCKTLNKELSLGYRVSSCQFRTYQKNNDLIAESGHVISTRGYCTASIGGSPDVIRKSDIEPSSNRYDGCLVMNWVHLILKVFRVWRITTLS